MDQLVLDRGGLADVIGALKTAPLGNKMLDLLVANVIGRGDLHLAKIARLLVSGGYSWDVISQIFDEDLPPYSTSLDARLPEENIVFVMHSAPRGQWAALQRTAEGSEHLAWAATEALARRLAALQSRPPVSAENRVAPAHRPAGDQPGAVQIGAAQMESAVVGDGEAPKEWNIRF